LPSFTQLSTSIIINHPCPTKGRGGTKTTFHMMMMASEGKKGRLFKELEKMKHLGLSNKKTNLIIKAGRILPINHCYFRGSFKASTSLFYVRTNKCRFNSEYSFPRLAFGD
jgi:hypothetical protein